MIAILIAACFAILFLFLSWACFRNHRNPGLSRALSLAFAALATISMVVGLACYPAARVWQANRYAEAAEAAARGDAEQAKALIVVLGGADAYLEYLKARRAE